MDVQLIDKEVYFHEYCKKCKHYKTQKPADICDRCLDEPSNVYSHKPVYFEEDKSLKPKEKSVKRERSK